MLSKYILIFLVSMVPLVELRQHVARQRLLLVHERPQRFRVDLDVRVAGLVEVHAGLHQSEEWTKLNSRTRKPQF